MVEEKDNSIILVADDNPNNLQVMESMLSEFGFDIRVAMNGVEALASVNEDPPDLVVLDIHMPEMDGYETCQRLKQQETTRDIPVIFASAMNEEFNKVKGFEIGAVDYVAKPINMEELRARVTVHLQLAKQRKTLQTQARELKAFNDTMLEREMRVIELKKEVNKLSRELGRAEPYSHVD
ncbi:response regulator [Aliikangiella marina]|uniref:histidine kinase n=1 Tax=Aliikangiella marina TaxID=1712262 RepID=A0A545T7I2_9GAMM|nr:response regulator [Aliikangiella marina]TQV73176.1 response regulator [Aliikangiella marina]